MYSTTIVRYKNIILLTKEEKVIYVIHLTTTESTIHFCTLLLKSHAHISEGVDIGPLIIYNSPQSFIIMFSYSMFVTTLGTLNEF